VSAGPRETSRPLLRVEGLVTAFDTEGGVVRAVDGGDLTVEAGRTLGLVG
jgi:ABC-type dipeptide/oligopeptide/nickel transport system ATPase component